MKVLKSIVILTVVIASFCCEAQLTTGKVDIPMTAFTCESGNTGVCAIGSNCGMNSGSSCIQITSDATTIAAARTAKIPQLSSGTLWWVTVHTLCTGSIPPIILLGGVDFMFFSNLLSDKLSNGWNKYDFLVRIPSGYDSGSYVRFWSYNYVSSCNIDNVTIAPASVVEFESSVYGPLGSYEKIAINGNYTNTLGKTLRPTGNYHRNVAFSNCSWDSQDLVVYTGSLFEIEYSLKSAFLTIPTLTIQNGANFNMITGVYASNDHGSTWQHLIDISTEDTFVLTLPSVSHTRIRLIAKDTASGWNSAYFSYIELQAMVTPPSELITGREAVLSLDSISTSGYSLSLTSNNYHPKEEDCSSLSPIPIFITSSTSASLTFSMTPRISYSAMYFKNPTISVGSTISNVTLLYHLAGGKPQVGDYVAKTTSGNIVLSGKIWLTPMHSLLDTAYGELLSSSSSNSIWWCSSTYKVSKYRKAPATTSTTGVIVKASKNEREPFQVVVRAKSSSVTVSSVSIGNLNGNNGKTFTTSNEVTIRRVGYVKTDNPTDTIIGIKGAYWPDPLIPLDLPFICSANTNCPLWFLIHIGPNVTEGDYTGQISMTVDSVASTIPLKLTVWNFTIPKHSQLKSSFGLFYWNLWKYLGIDTTEQKKIAYPLYLKSFEEHRLSPYSPNIFNEYWGTVENTNGVDHYKMYWDNYDPIVPEIWGDDGYGFTTQQISLAGLNFCSSGTCTSIGSIKSSDGTVNDFGSTEYTRLFTEYAQAVQNHFQSVGTLDKTFLYWFDEPTPSDYAFLKQGMDAVHTAAPKVMRYLTEPPVTQLYGSVDIWCPVLLQYDSKLSHQRQAAGEHMWEYIAGCSVGDKRLDMYLDRPGIALRLWLWHIFFEDLEGILIWDTIAWAGEGDSVHYPNGELQDPYEDPMCWNGEGGMFGNADGAFFYPPVNWKTATTPLVNVTPVESIRWEMMREGLEDWEYLRILKQTIKNRPNVPTDIKERANKLLTFPSSLYVSDANWAYEPTELLARRDEIGDLLNEIGTTEDASTTNDDKSKTNNEADEANQQTIKLFNLFIVSLLAILFV